MKPLRILFVAPYVPSPIRVRPFQLIRHLAQMGHHITLAALDDGLPRDNALTELRDICDAVHIVPHSKVSAAASCLAALPSPTPLWAAYCRSPRMEGLLQTLASSGNFDVAHVEHLRAAHWASALGSLPRIIDAVDCITELRRQIMEQGEVGGRLFSWQEWMKLRTYEPRAYRAFSRIAVTSAHDARALALLDPARLPPIDVIPNGVDTDYFCAESLPAGDMVSEDNCLVFSGKLSYIANDDAARFLLGEVLPRVRGICPDARLVLAGSGPSPRLREMAARAGNVHVTGYVEDLRPYIACATVAVCPIRIGVGIQNKVLEAMAMARPVVASSLAARALGSESNSDGALTVADGADAVAVACAGLLENTEQATRAGQAARRIVEAKYRWQTAGVQFTSLYESVMESAGTPA